MKLSTRTRYGVRAIIELAMNYGKGPLQIRVIAQRQDISVKYLEQLMAMLNSKGGYVLTRAPNQIKLSDVFNCLEGSPLTVECLENKDYCERVADCVTRQVWAQVQKAIKNVLQSITIQDLVDRAKVEKNLDYQI